MLAHKLYAGTIGTAADYRFRYYFRSYDAHKTVAADGVEVLGDGPLGRLGREFLIHLNELVARIEPARSELAADDESALNAHCVILALYEQVFRAGVTTQFNALPRRATVSKLLTLALPDMVQDVSQLSHAFVSDAAEFIKADAVLNSRFRGSIGVGGADADIIVGKTLVDFKCRAKLNSTKLRNDVLQLLGYVLLDYDDEYSISELVIYMPRHRFLWREPLWKFILPPEAILEASTSNRLPKMDAVSARLRKLRTAAQKVVEALPRPCSVAQPAKE